jgi:hypothetical protein
MTTCGFRDEGKPVGDQAMPRRTAPAGGDVRVPAVPDRRPRTPGTTAGRPPPPRPGLTAAPAFPGAAVEERRPVAVRLSVTLWSAVCAAGLWGLLAMLADGDALRARLTATATAAEPTTSAATISDGVRVTILVVLGAGVALTVLLLAGAVLLLRRQAWVRWPLAVLGLLALFAAGVAQSVASGGVDLDRIGFITQAGLVVLALIPLCARSTGRWLRRTG